MRKLLLIIVLCLFWCNVGLAKKYYQGKHGKYPEGVGKLYFCDKEIPAGLFIDSSAFCRKASIYFQDGFEINDGWKDNGHRRYAIFKNVTRPIQDQGWDFKFGSDGIFVAITHDYSEAMKIINNLKNPKPDLNIAKENDDERRIASCKKYGFKEGTEKLGDCVMKIMEMEIKQLETQRQIESANINNQQQRKLSLQQQKLIQTQQLNQSIRMMQMGLDLMSPKSVAPAPLPNPSFNCRFIANNMYCN